MAQDSGLTFAFDNPGQANTLTGTVGCYYDVVTVISRLAQREFAWPCCFVESAEDRLLLGRAGFLDEFNIAIRDGALVVSRPVSWRRWLSYHMTRVAADTL